jgi:preprotein translocase subunit SecG
VVLIQRSEGGGLGLGGAQGMGNFLSGRGTANLLTRTTAILGTAFFALSLVLALLYKGGAAGSAASILALPANTPASIPGPAVPGSANSLPQTPADARPAAPAPATPSTTAPTSAVPLPSAPQPAAPQPVAPQPVAPQPGKTN